MPDTPVPGAAPKIDAAARAVERLEKAVAALQTNSDKAAQSAGHDGFDQFARSLYNMRTVFGGVTGGAGRLSVAYRTQATAAATAERAIARQSRAMQGLADLAGKQMAALLARQHQVVGRTSATGAPAPKAVLLAQQRGMLLDRHAERAALLASASRERSAAADLPGKPDGRRALAATARAEADLHRQDQRARLSEARSARKLEASPAVATRLEQAGRLSARREIEEEALALTRSIRLAKARAKAYASPEGKAALQQQLKLQQQLAKAQAAGAFSRARAERGLLGAYAGLGADKLQGLEKSLQGAAREAQALAVSMSTASLSLAAVADPMSAWPTFTESLRGLGIVLGSQLLGPLDAASERIQQLTRGIERLSPSTRASAVSIAVMGAGALVAMASVYKLAAALHAAAAAGVTLSLTTGGLFLLAGAVGAIAANYALLRNNADAAGDAMGRANGGHGRADRAVTGADFDRLSPADRAALQGLQGRPFQEELRKRIAEAEQQADRARGQEATRGPALAALDRMAQEAQAAQRRAAARHGMGLRLAHGDLENPLPGNLDRAHVPGSLSPPLSLARQLLRERSYRRELEEHATPERQAELRAELRRLGIHTGPLTGENYFRALARRDLSAQATSPARQAAERLDLLQALQEKVGLQRAYRGPSPSIITDPTQLGDKIQLRALKGDDLTDTNEERILRNAERNGELLREIRDMTAEQLRRATPGFRY